MVYINLLFVESFQSNMGAYFLMIALTLGLLTILSLDILVGFALFLLWKYLDLKYFSTSDIEQLKTENDYLKKQTNKITNVIWSDKEYDNLR